MTLVIGAIGAFVACAVGGLVGFASSLLLLPVLLLLGVPMWEAVGLNLTLAALTRLPSVVALRSFVNYGRTGLMLAGSLPGIGVGLVVGQILPTTVLELAVGAVIVVSGLIMLSKPTAPAASRPGSFTVMAAGGCAGLLGVTTSLNGVPPALLLARTGDPIRTRLGDLSVFFTVGNCVTIAAIAVTQDAPVLQGSPEMAAWITAGIFGNAVGLGLARLLSEQRFNRITIWLVINSGVAALLRASYEIGAA